MSGSAAPGGAIPLWGKIRFRFDPPPVGLSSRDGWGWGSSPSTSLVISDGRIEIRGFGPFRKVAEAFGGPLSFVPAETVMWTVALGEYLGGWRVPWMKPREWLALSCTLSNGTEYTLALRPQDGDFNGLRAALRAVGVADA